MANESIKKFMILFLFLFFAVTLNIQGLRTQDSTTTGIAPDITLGHLGDNDENIGASFSIPEKTTPAMDSITTSVSSSKGGIMLDSEENDGKRKEDRKPSSSNMSFPTNESFLPSSRPPRPGIGIDEGIMTHIFNLSALTCQSSCFGICNIEALAIYRRNWQCACDPACVVYDDCCFDYEAQCLRKSPETRIDTSAVHVPPNPEPKKVTTVLPSVGEDGIYDDDILHRPEKSEYLKCLPLKYYDITENRLNNFLFISKCPMEYPNDMIKYRCESDEPMELLDILPVDAAFGEDLLLVPYKNIFCARCHDHKAYTAGGEINSLVTYWHHKYQAKMDCSLERPQNNIKRNSDHNIEELMKELGYNTTFDNVQTFLLQSRKCALHFDKIPLHVHACFPEVINNCNNSQNNGKIVEQSCRSYTASVQIQLKDAGIKRYQNAHCALCNGEPLDMLTCISRQNDPTYRPTYRLPNSVLPLSILLDTTDSNGFVLQIEGKNFTVEASCPQQFVYDPFIKTCRQLHGVGNEVIICKPNVILLELTMNVLMHTTHTFKLDELYKNVQKQIVVSLDVDDADNVILNVTKYAADELLSGHVHKYNISCFVKRIVVNRFSELVKNIDVLHEKLVSYGVISNLVITAGTPNSLYKTMCKHGANVTNTELTNYTEININCKRSLYINQSDEMFTLETIEVQFLLPERIFLRSENQLIETYILTCPEAERSNKTNLNCKNKLLYNQVEFEYINDSIRIISSNIVHGPNDYVEMSDGSILVCNIFNRTYNLTISQRFLSFDETQVLLMLIFTIMSLIGLFITFLTYCLLKELRNLPGKLMINLVAALFTAQLILLVNRTDNSGLCKAFAVIAHYFWLAAFCWMNALCFAVYRTFYKVKVQQTFQSLSSFVLVKYVLYGWGFPAVIVATCITLDLATDAPFTYGDDIKCWISENNAILYGFTVPIGILILANILFTVTTLYNLYKTKKSISNVLIRKRDRLLLVVVIKLSTILGATWIIGYIASWTQSVVLWYFFIILNSSQGLLVCIAFVMTRRVYRLCLKSIKRSNSRRSTRSTRDVSSSSTTVL